MESKPEHESNYELKSGSGPESNLSAAPESNLGAGPESSLSAAPESSLGADPESSLSAAPESVRLAGIEEDSIVDGPGLRLVVFTQGCPHHCPGCHNPGTHPFEGGTISSVEALLGRYRENPLLSGITFSGGEPFCQPTPLALLGAAVHRLGGDVVTYTGYLYEELLTLSEEDAGIRALLEVTDLLIDGPYLEAERSLELTFRGSRNQRLIRLKKDSILPDEEAAVPDSYDF